MNINAENNPFVHVCTLSNLPYIDFHIPRKNLERLYFKFEFWRFFGITIGIWDSTEYSLHHIRIWKQLRFYTRPIRNNTVNV
jgi:hypothetical protein